MNMIKFKLSLCATCLRQLSAAVRRSTKSMAKEKEARKAGRKIAQGSNNPVHLETIANWKSARKRALLTKNTKTDLKQALGIARDHQTDASGKIIALCNLRGVGPPMASAILTAMYPKSYTVIDVRALDALGIRGPANHATIYPAYLSFCITTADEMKMKLRDFDRALWKAGTG